MCLLIRDSQQIRISLKKGPDFQRRNWWLHLQNLHICKQIAWCTNYIFWHAIYQYLDARTTVVLHADLNILHIQLASLWTFYWCNLCTFFKNIWPFCSLEPHVLPFCIYNRPTFSSFPEKLIEVYFLTNKEVSLLLSGRMKKLLSDHWQM